MSSGTITRFGEAGCILKETNPTMLKGSVIAVAMLCACVVAPAQGQELSRGQTVYVPVYSRIMHGDLPGKDAAASTVGFSTMLLIRNVDPSHTMAVRAVRYYDTDGKLLREESAAQRTLDPLGTESVFISYGEKEGGVGANFIVVWEAEVPMDVPIIETVNTYFIGTAMAVFTSRGQPIHK